jgi:hypothetical protein
MNLSKIFFRDKQEMSVDVWEAWEVRWTSRYGAFASDTKPEMKIFTTEEDANQFADALRDAFKLIKTTSGTGVSIIKQ